MLGAILSAKKDSKSMMWSALIGAVANIILNIALVYIIGIQGATIATVICSYIIYVVRKIAVGKDITIERYYTVLGTWLLLCLQAVTAIYLKSYIIEVVLMTMMLIINISVFLEIIQTGKILISNYKK